MVDESRDETKVATKAKRLPQYIGGLVACIGGFSLGSAIGWNAPATSILQSKNGFTNFDNSLIGSALAVGASIGIVIVPFLIDRIGRRGTMLIIVPPFLGGWAILAFAYTNLYAYLAGRILTGACGGMYCVVAPIYTAEVSETRIRGTLGAFFQLLLVHGILYAYCTGYIDRVSIISMLCGIPPIVLAIMMIFVPESPFFYMTKDKEDEARRSMRFFRGNEYDIEPDIDEMKKTTAMNKQRKFTCAMLKRKTIIKTLGVAYALMIAQQMSGINIVLYYAVTLFQSAGAKMDPLFQSIIVAVVQVVVCIIVALIIDKVGRRLLMVVSEVAMGICLFILVGYFMLQEKKPEIAKNIDWLPLVTICFFVVSYSLGAGPIPWAYMGEIFPAEMKGAGSSSAAFLNWLICVAVTISFSTASGGLGPALAFSIFGGCCFVSAVFCLIFMIETKGKTLDQIQRELGNDDGGMAEVVMELDGS